MWLKFSSELIATLGAASISYSAFLVSHSLGFCIAGIWLLVFSFGMQQRVKK